MKTKYFYLAALASLTLASCSSDDFIAEAPPVEVENTNQVPIMFSSIGRGMTRADFIGADAAKKLGNEFVVSGYKGSKTEWQAAASGDILKSSIVFDNYKVEYEENTAHTTESNTNNWEYVGVDPIKHATDNGITQQTIKYWDYSVPQYDFIAWSTGSKDAIYEKGTGDVIPTGKVYVTAITPTTATGTSGTIAYKFEGEADDLKECYIADLVTVYKGNATGTAPFYNVVEKGYQQPVTLRFRQLGTKVRIGIYETVPGYSVKDVQFYSAADVKLVEAGDYKPGSTTEQYDADGAAEVNASARIFTTQENGINKEGTYTVTFPTVDKPTDADNNQAHIAFDGKPGAAQKTTIEWGTMDYTYRESGESSKDAIYLGRTSNTATFANKDKAEQNYYEVFLPNEAGTNLNLRVNYTLESIDGSKETIVVKGATAQVPSIYTTWKPGYAYTYLFKISDKTNGHTGVYDPTKPDDTTVNSDPVGLYPITFDAIVVNAEDGDKTQETITLVSTPSITTYQNGSNVVNNNEYTVLTTSTDKPEITGEIYVTVNDGGPATYEEVTGLNTGDDVSKYYTMDSQDNYTPCAADAKKGDDDTKYYKLMVPSLPNGVLATLTGKANLYTLPALPTGRTAPWSEAEVIDALQMQDDDADANTVKGRSGLVLAEATNITTDADLAAGQWKLTNEVTYGVDGNKITVSTDQAAKFIPTANTTYAFVYTKQAATTEAEKKYQALNWDGFETGQTKYRYDYKDAKVVDNKGTEDTSDDVTTYDAQKGHVYFSRSGAGDTNDPYVYTKVDAPFIGQGVGNLFTDAACTQAASGFAVTGTTYYYTPDGGITKKTAHNVNYNNFGNTLWVWDSTADEGNGAYVANTDATPVDGTAYYFKEANDTYTYCVILPQQTTDWKELDTTKYVIATETDKVNGQTYFDMYTVNNGVYYTKIIKVAPAN